MPECAHCARRFNMWHHLRHHVECQCCTNFAMQRPLQELYVHSAGIQQMLADGQYPDLLSDPLLQEEALSRCLVCGQRFTTVLTLSSHFGVKHKSLLTAAVSVIPNIAQHLRVTADKACTTCHLTAPRKHRCIVAKQLAILIVMRQKISGVADTSSPAQLRSTEPRCKTTMNTPTFQISRDCANGMLQCAHCGHTFKTLKLHQHHIEQRACVKFNPAKLPSTHVLIQNPVFRRYLGMEQALDIARDTRLTAVLVKECLFCGLQFSKADLLSKHLAAEHPDWYATSRNDPKATPARARAACVCGKRFRGRVHKCPVYAQIGMLRAMLTDRNCDNPEVGQNFLHCLWTFLQSDACLSLNALDIPRELACTAQIRCHLCDADLDQDKLLQAHFEVVHPDLYACINTFTSLLKCGGALCEACPITSMAQACLVILHYQGLLATLVLLHGGRRSFHGTGRESSRTGSQGLFRHFPSRQHSGDESEQETTTTFRNGSSLFYLLRHIKPGPHAVPAHTSTRRCAECQLFCRLLDAVPEHRRGQHGLDFDPPIEAVAYGGTQSGNHRSLPWKLQINPVKGEQLIRYMEKLSQSSLWLLIQGRLRPCSMQRSGLAQEIQRQLKK